MAAKVYMEQGGDRKVVANGGSISIGDVILTATAGNVIITGIPTSDPAVAGALWSNSGVLTISAG